MKRIGLTASEEMSFENVDRRTDGQNIENRGKQNLLIKNLVVTFDLCHKQSFFFSNFTFGTIKTYDLLILSSARK